MIKKTLLTAAAFAITMSASFNASADGYYNYSCLNFQQGGVVFSGTTTSYTTLMSKKASCEKGGGQLLWGIIRNL